MIDLSKKTATSANDIKLVQIFGQEAPVFAHNPNGDDTALAVVPLSFVQKIAKNMRQAPLHIMKDEFIRNVELVLSVDQYYELLESELAFHKTLDMLSKFCGNRSEPVDHPSY